MPVERVGAGDDVRPATPRKLQRGMHQRLQVPCESAVRAAQPPRNQAQRPEVARVDGEHPVGLARGGLAQDDAFGLEGAGLFVCGGHGCIAALERPRTRRRRPPSPAP